MRSGGQCPSENIGGGLVLSLEDVGVGLEGNRGVPVAQSTPDRRYAAGSPKVIARTAAPAALSSNAV